MHNTRKSIAYIELDTHPEIATRFLELMGVSENFEVDFYVSDKIAKALPNLDQIKVIITQPKTLLEQLSRQHYDVVIIGTVHRYFNVFYEVVKRYKTGIITHNLNFVEAKNSQLFHAIFKKETRYRLKLALREGLFLKSKVYQKAQQLWVLDRDLEHTHYQYLPLFFAKAHQPTIKNEAFTIIIPGSVDQHRRDYQAVIHQLKTHQGIPLTIVFLGQAKGQELGWIKALECAFHPSLKLIYFNEKVEAALFDEWMARADVLWCPIQKQTEFMSIPETYGRTKMSGNIGDAVTYQKPIVLSKNLAEVLDIKSAKVYKNEDYSRSKVLKQLENVLLEFCK